MGMILSMATAGLAYLSLVQMYRKADTFGSCT